MTDDPNIEGAEELEDAAGADEAADLDDAELEAAAERAKLEVDDEEAGVPVEDLDDLEDEAVEAPAALAPGRTGLEPTVRGPRARSPKPAEHVAYAVDPA